MELTTAGYFLLLSDQQTNKEPAPSGVPVEGDVFQGPRSIQSSCLCESTWQSALQKALQAFVTLLLSQL